MKKVFVFAFACLGLFVVAGIVVQILADAAAFLLALLVGAAVVVVFLAGAATILRLASRH